MHLKPFDPNPRQSLPLYDRIMDDPGEGSLSFPYRIALLQVLGDDTHIVSQRSGLFRTTGGGWYQPLTHTFTPLLPILTDSERTQ